MKDNKIVFDRFKKLILLFILQIALMNDSVSCRVAQHKLLPIFETQKTFFCSWCHIIQNTI